MTDKYQARSKMIQTARDFLQACGDYQSLPPEEKSPYLDVLLPDAQFHANKVLQLAGLSEEKYRIPLSELPLTEAVYRELKGKGYDTLGDLVAAGRKEVKKVKNVGDKKLDDLNRKLLEKYQVEIP